MAADIRGGCFVCFQHLNGTIKVLEAKKALGPSRINGNRSCIFLSQQKFGEWFILLMWDGPIGA